nr:uncharacterized protein LOC104648452 [Solanum lycopersicum]
MPNMLEAEKKKKEDSKRNEKYSGEDKGDSSKKILQNRRKQEIIYGNKGSNSQLSLKEMKDADNEKQIIHAEFESLGEDNPLDDYNATLINNNIDNTCLYPLLQACEELESEKFNERNESNIRWDQEDSFEKEHPDQQQEGNIDGESNLNQIACEDGNPDNYHHIIKNNIINYGSRLLAKDENGGNYHFTQGLPRSTKFRSIGNLYKCTSRLSPIEDEYNWNHLTKKDPNMNH